MPCNFMVDLLIIFAPVISSFSKEDLGISPHYGGHWARGNMIDRSQNEQNISI